MVRAARLFDLIQALRRHRRPVTAAVLAEETGVSPRTLYRDIATLTALGAPIQGEAGLGYILRPGFLLPPLMLLQIELDAVALGLAWVAEAGDPELATAARDAMAKVAAVLPPALADAPDGSGLLVGPPVAPGPHLGAVRRALRAERRLRLAYADAKGRTSTRVVWPIALGFMAEVRMLAAWDELRGDFRHFRLDRIGALEVLDERPPKTRRRLLAEWRARDPGLA